MFRRALKGREKAFGRDHKSTLTAVNQLGLLYRDQGKLDKAEEMFWRAREGYEKALGRDHMLKFTAVNNLGLLYRDQGKLEKIEEIYRRVLGGQRRHILGATTCRRLPWSTS